MPPITENSSKELSFNKGFKAESIHEKLKQQAVCFSYYPHKNEQMFVVFLSLSKVVNGG